MKVSLSVPTKPNKNGSPVVPTGKTKKVEALKGTMGKEKEDGSRRTRKERRFGTGVLFRLVLIKKETGGLW